MAKILVMGITVVIGIMFVSTLIFYNAPETKNQAKDFVLFQDDILQYEVYQIPEYANQTSINNAVIYAVMEWKTRNLDLDFELVESNSDFKITWEKDAGKKHIGYTDLGLWSVDKITVSLGDFNCKNEWIPHNEGMITNIIMHEIGHILKLEHTNDIDNLMYGNDEFTQGNFNNLGYDIPEPVNEDYVGRPELMKQYQSLKESIEILDQEYAYLNSRYEKFPQVIYDDEVYDRAMKIYDELKTVGQNYNNLIGQKNLIADEINCFPNTENLNTGLVRLITVP